MKEILLIVPSRERPHLIQNFIDSWKGTTQGKSDIIMGLDIDDPEVTNYPMQQVDHIISKRMELNEKNNLLTDIAIKRGYEIIGCLSDDFVFQTYGWEDKMIKWQKENKGICYGNDLLQGEKLPTAPFFHRDIILPLGYVAPPSLIHYFVDNYALELGMRLGKIKYFDDIIIEHKHWANKKATKDSIYSESEKVFAQDRDTWDKYRESKLAEDVEKILSYQKS